MRINPIRLFSINNNNLTKKYPNLAPLKNDVVSFGQEPDGEDIIDLSAFLNSSDPIEPSTPEEAPLESNDENGVTELPDLSEVKSELPEDAPSKLISNKELFRKGPFSYNETSEFLEMPETD